ncbi:uncharacterized protein LOC116786505 [Chiroxiphia lanceolata]|uniref:uncharacterized protein LOC116786505 n=1 Tax=Chiroxiphia lanceolata TaxID=296741 RepID=UPI0013CEEFCE|nr:uncharacterized protein LOC116786505 [Chiroxiphia lanceolata]
MRDAPFYRLAAARQMEIFQAARRKGGKKRKPGIKRRHACCPGGSDVCEKECTTPSALASRAFQTPQMQAGPKAVNPKSQCEQRMRCWSASFPICCFTSGLKMQSHSGGSFPHAAASISRLWAAGKETQLFHKTFLKGLTTSIPGTQETWIPGLNFREAKTRRPAVQVSINTLCKSSGPALNSAVLLRHVSVHLPSSFPASTQRTH